MNWKLNFAVCAAIFAALVYSCSGPTDSEDTRLPGLDRIEPRLALGSSNVLLNGYQVNYDGGSYDCSDDQTTFSYTVSGTGVPPALSHFNIEIPECDPPMTVVSTDPDESVVGLDGSTGIYGVKWDQDLGTNDTRTYSLTLAGSVSEGTTRGVVKGGNGFEAGYILGPSCDQFDISGTVFVDADEDMELDPIEFGIPRITVVLKRCGVVWASAKTDANGDYLFADQTAASYVIEINSTTSDPEDFNEQLVVTFSGDTTLAVTIGPDSPDNNFGFVPSAEEIIDSLESGSLEATGLPVRFWKRQLRTAITGGPFLALEGEGPRTFYTPEEMLGFLEEINELLLEQPYQLEIDPDPSVGFSQALDILNENSTPIDRLLRQLLATEFNEVSGNLIVNAEGLQRVLISWGESLAAGALGLPGSGAQKTAITLDAATAVFERLNESSGGGTSGG